jgi:hypothetical protein
MSHSSSNSSLANAFGMHAQQQMGSAPAGRVTFAEAPKKDESESPAAQSSRASSVSAEGAGLSSDPESTRPSFKRLPSQTLGPANAKRTFLGFGEDEERVSGWGPGLGPDVSSGGTATDANTNPGPTVKSNAGHPFGMSHPDRIVASLAERRRRRMSAPSVGYMPLEPGAGLGLDLDKDQNEQQQGQREPQKTQGQEKGQGQGERDFPAVGYAPSAPQ